MKIQIDWYGFVLVSQCTANIKTHRCCKCGNYPVFQNLHHAGLDFEKHWAPMPDFKVPENAEHFPLWKPGSYSSLPHTHLTLNRSYGIASNRYRLQLFTLKLIIFTLWGSLSSPSDAKGLIESSQTAWCFSLTRIWKWLHTKKKPQQNNRANESVKMMGMLWKDQP